MDYDCEQEQEREREREEREREEREQWERVEELERQAAEEGMAATDVHHWG